MVIYFNYVKVKIFNYSIDAAVIIFKKMSLGGNFGYRDSYSWRFYSIVLTHSRVKWDYQVKCT